MNSEFTGSGSKPESYAPPWRLYGWILSCVVSLALFVGRGSLAGQCIQKTVYYFSSAALLVFLYYFISWLYRAWRTWCPPRTVLLLGGGLVLVSGCFLWVHADFSFKTLPDEYMTASIARNLHESREAFVTQSGLREGQAFIPTETFVSSHMWLYPYLVACSYDVFGDWADAPMVVNFFLLLLFLATFFYFTWRLAGVLAAVLGCMLWLSLPLLLHAGSGGGSAMLELLLLVCLCILASAYLRGPSRDSEGALIMGLILLMYASVSALCFVIPVLYVIVRGWIRAERRFLSFGLITLPLWLLPCAWQLGRSLRHEAGGMATWLIETWQHAPDYFPHLLNFFFNADASQPNSLLLSFGGLVAMVALPFLMRSELKRYIAAGNFEVSLVCLLAPFIILELTVRIGLLEGQLDRFAGSFQALNLHFVMIAAILLNLVHLRSRIAGLQQAFILLLIFYIIGFTVPNLSKSLYVRGDYRLSEQRWLQQLGDESLLEDALVIDRVDLPWAFRRWTCLVPEEALPLLESERFATVYLVERLSYLGEGEFASIYPVERAILESCATKIVAEKSFRPFSLTRIHELVSKNNYR